MFRHLMSYGVTSLVLGFATVSPFPSMLSAVVTGICAVALAAKVNRAPAPRRRLALALMILAVACYAVIAAGRAMYVSAPALAEAASRARYHYVGTVPIAILLCVIVSQLTSGLRDGGALHVIAVLAWLGSATVCSC